MASDHCLPNSFEATDSEAKSLPENRLDVEVLEETEEEETEELEEGTSEENSFFVVGIGASAGGLRALEDFFAHMPQDSGAAFVIIQHLSPDYKSLMKELLGRCTRMAIHRVEDGMALAPDSIYLIPPGQNLVASSGQLHLTKQERLHRGHPNFPIDLFFESLAEDCPERSIVIVLSGTGSDGARGIQAVREAGGITLAQDPTTAEFDGMPQNAIATGKLDRSLPAPELAQLVYRLVSHAADRQVFQHKALFVQIQETHLQQILQLLSIHEGIDFSQYKPSTLSRRIQRRCLIAGFRDLNSYLDVLETSAEERQALRCDLLISVTRFFRDSQVWEFMATEVLPPLVEAMSAAEPLRIWVTACATGEEAYSMAMMIDELAMARGKPVHAKIFATDLGRQFLEQAAQGVYPATIAAEVSESRLQRYFTFREKSYEIIRTIREMIVFAPHNLVKDAGFSRMHLVSCRNVLIYMEPPLQQQVLRSLHFSLRSHGLLFLGESETLGNLEDEFIPRDRRCKIYEKRRNVRLTKIWPDSKNTALSAISKALPSNFPSTPNFGADSRLQEAFRLLVSEQQGCCLIVDERGYMIHAFGATPDILPPPNGPVSNEVVKMVALPLQLPLSTALNNARKTQGPVHYSAIDLPSETDPAKVKVRVSFHQGNRLVEDFFIVLIQSEDPTLTIPQELNSEDLGQATAQRIFELESELQKNRESLQATIEELETTNEEQQAANEELIASNEELQSANEELQSVNEELYTVKLKQIQATLQQRNQDLQQEIGQRQSALLALQESEARFRCTFEQAAVGITHIAPEGSLLRLNQRFADIIGYPKQELLNKKFQEITHPVDLAANLAYRDQLLTGDIPTYTMAKRYIRKDQSIVWVEVTVALSRADNGEPRYFISVIQDISLRKRLEKERDLIWQELVHEKELAQVTLHSIGDAVITTDAEARVQYCNPVAEQLTGWSTAEARGRRIQEVITLLDEDSREPALHPVAAILAKPQGSLTVEHLLLVSRNGREFSVSKSAAPMRDRQGNLLGVVTVFRDVTEARTLSRQLSWQASHDPLTGLINRRQFEQVLIQSLANVRMDERQEHVLCYLDLDQFKVVNDTSGHLAGDELLRQVAMLLKSRVRGSDCLARLGGDEFGVLLQTCPLSRAEIIADQLREAIQAFRFVWEKRTFSIGVSIGLVAINSNVLELPNVLSAADAACYAAKERGRNRVYVYQPDDVDVTRQRSEREWSVRIRNALERNQFCLYQQSVAPAQPPDSEAAGRYDSKAAGRYEVLLRMIDEEGGGLIPPNAFIPAAERYDLMPQVDRWVIQRFLLHIAAQRELAFDSTTYMVNLSGASLTDDTFFAFLHQALKNDPSVAQRICFEITETAAISNLTEAVNFIDEMQKLGCQFALDDFGSGASSFGYLKTLPVSYIKIDGAFVRDIDTDPTARAIVESINNIGHVMGLQTIAESVENDAIQHCLQEIGVDYVQGYGIAHPQPLETCR